MSKKHNPKTIADVTDIIPENEDDVTLRRKAQKHYGRKDILIVRQNGEIKAEVMGEGEEVQQPAKPTKRALPAVPPADESNLLFEDLPTYLRHQAKAYVWDLFHGSNYYGIRRRMMRERKVREFEASIGLVRK